MAGQVDFNLSCIIVDSVGLVTLSDYNRLVISLDLESGQFTYPDGINQDVADRIVYVIHKDRNMYSFTKDDYNAAVGSAFDSSSNSVAVCPSVTREEGLSVLKAQEVPYVIYTDMQDGTEKWSTLSSAECDRIVKSGGRIDPGVYVLEGATASMMAANVGYTCGAGTFDWLTAFREVDRSVIQWQQSAGWSMNGITTHLRFSTTTSVMPALPGCVAINDMNKLITSITSLLDSMPCMINVNGSRSMVKPCRSKS